MDQKVDYIIVGDGFGAVFFAHQLIKHGKSFKLFSAGKESASHISAGVCNPIILKRYSKMWNAEDEMDYLPLVFSEIQQYLGVNYLIEEGVVRIFHDEKEKETWLKKANADRFKNFLSTNIKSLKNVENPFGAGEVLGTYRVDVKRFFKDFLQYLKGKDYLVEETFLYEDLNIENNSYHNLEFKNIVFAEGVGIKQNTYFSEIPIQPNKGHCFNISIEKPIDDYVIKKKHFLFSFDKDVYYYGGTYDRFSQTAEIEDSAVHELENSLKDVYLSNYKILNIKTAFRSTVDDRRPIIGKHKKYDNLFLLNGLGARGALNGSFFSNELYQFIEHGYPINDEVDIQRFYKLN